MKKQTANKLVTLALTIGMTLSLTACVGDNDIDFGGKDSYKVGICNYVDDASLNQINENIQARLKEIGEERHGLAQPAVLPLSGVVFYVGELLHGLASIPFLLLKG